MYDPKCSLTFPWCTIDAPVAFPWCMINAPAAFAWCTNHFVHKVEFAYKGWDEVYPLCSVWTWPGTDMSLKMINLILQPFLPCDNEWTGETCSGHRCMWWAGLHCMRCITHWGQMTHSCLSKLDHYWKITACCLINAKPLSEPTPPYCWLPLWEQMIVKFE